MELQEKKSECEKCRKNSAHIVDNFIGKSYPVVNITYLALLTGVRCCFGARNVVNLTLIELTFFNFGAKKLKQWHLNFKENWDLIYAHSHSINDFRVVLLKEQ